MDVHLTAKHVRGSEGRFVRATTHRLAGLIRRAFPLESQRLFALTVAVGVVCGLLAVAFHEALRGAEALFIDRALHAGGMAWVGWTLVTPVLGGLVAGLVLAYVVPGARGSGIPQVKAAFALGGGNVPFKDMVGKFFLAALQIGTGASLGREGPTVQLCGGAASALARVAALPKKDARRLLPVGAAAGVAAIFNAPIAAVTFTIEEIVGSLDHAVLSGVVVAAALAAVIERSVLGTHPVIEVHEAYGLDHPDSLIIYALLGVTAAFVAIAFTDLLLWLRLFFRRQKVVPVWAQPAVGGLATGVLAVAVLGALGTTGVTGGGYAVLGQALAGQLGFKVLVVLCVVKILATSAAYSSGGAGGIFAPTLFVGAMLGGAFGYLDVSAFGHEPKQLGAFALVGMGAVFAGAVRAPITSVLIIFEMTGGYGLVLPLMLSNMTAYVIAKRLRPTPIYDALLEQDGIVLPRAEPPRQSEEPSGEVPALPGDTVLVAPTRADVPVPAAALVDARTVETAPVAARAPDDTPRLTGVGPPTGPVDPAWAVGLHASAAPVSGGGATAASLALPAPVVQAGEALEVLARALARSESGAVLVRAGVEASPRLVERGDFAALAAAATEGRVPASAGQEVVRVDGALPVAELARSPAVGWLVGSEPARIITRARLGQALLETYAAPGPSREPDALKRSEGAEAMTAPAPETKTAG